jgi:hypothetical protein
MTLVSIKYTRSLVGQIDAREVRVGAHIGHGGQNLRKAASARARQRGRQDGSVFSLGTSTVYTSALLERTHDSLVYATDQQISHGKLLNPRF